MSSKYNEFIKVRAISYISVRDPAKYGAKVSLIDRLSFKWRPSKDYLADFCTSTLPKSLKTNLLYFKKMQMVKLSVVLMRKSPLDNFYMVSTFKNPSEDKNT